MQYPNDARITAVRYAFDALALTLIERGVLDTDRFFAYAGTQRLKLIGAGDTVAASALETIIDPLYAFTEALAAPGGEDSGLPPAPEQP